MLGLRNSGGGAGEPWKSRNGDGSLCGAQGPPSAFPEQVLNKLLTVTRDWQLVNTCLPGTVLNVFHILLTHPKFPINLLSRFYYFSPFYRRETEAQ